MWIAVVAPVTADFFVVAQRLVVLSVASELAPAYAVANEAVRLSLEVMATTLMQIGTLSEALADHAIRPTATALFAVAILRWSVMPKWLGWLGLAVALPTGLGLLEPVSDVFRFLGYPGFTVSGIWLLAIAVIMLRLREPVTGTAEP